MKSLRKIQNWMLIFELSGITGIWVTNLDKDKKIFHFDHRGILFLERENDGTQVLKGRNVAKTFENHCSKASTWSQPIKSRPQSTVTPSDTNLYLDWMSVEWMKNKLQAVYMNQQKLPDRKRIYKNKQELLITYYVG